MEVNVVAGSPLAKVYSFIDTLRRRAADAYANPLASASQDFQARVADPGRKHRLDLDTVAKEQSFNPDKMSPEGRAADERITQAVIDNYNPGGITTWHGGPNLLPRFSLSKSGSGMGQQNYGHGVYLAGAESTGDQYRRMITGTRLREKIADVAKSGKLSEDEILKRVMDDPSIPVNQKFLIQALWNEGSKKQFGSTRKAINNVLSHPGKHEVSKEVQDAAKNFGYLYKVDLPDKHVANMLDWDELLTKQGPVYDRLVSASNNPSSHRIRETFDKLDESSTGGEFIRALTNEAPAAHVPRIQKRLSEEMYEAGVPGNYYPDPYTQYRDKNYVVYPGAHRDLSVLQRNDMVPGELFNQPTIDALRLWGRR